MDTPIKEILTQEEIDALLRQVPTKEEEPGAATEVLPPLTGVVKHVRIITHVWPHLDEVVAIYLIEHSYKRQGFGVVLDFVFSENGLEGVEYSELQEEGVDIWVLGIGGGEFDEHGRNGEAPKTGECCATLVANKLGLRRNPALRHILDEALRADTGGHKGIFGLPRLLKARCMADPSTEGVAAAIGDVLAMLKALHAEQYELWGVAAPEFKAKADLHEFRGENGPIRLAVVDGAESPLVRDYAFLAEGGDQDIAVVKNGRGNVQIFFRSHTPDVASVARAVRYLEQQRAKDMAVWEWRELGAYGTVGTDRWYYMPGAIMNGSHSHTGVEPTAITTKEIVAFIKMAFGAAWPHEACRRGECLGDDCAWYKYGVRRCSVLRGKAATQAEREE